MKLKFYGVRGSLPVCDKEFLRYGGNTTCMRLTREKANRVVVIDAGTGIRNLGRDIVSQGIKQEVINVLFTHFHWDHIQGFPFFAPAYDRNQKVGILVMGTARKHKNLIEIFSSQMQSDYFPIQLNEMGAQFEFPDLGDDEILYGAKISAIPQQHVTLGGSYGLKIEDDEKKLVICTDVEHVEGIDDSIVNFARDADLLVHDGQYTSNEYERFKGWGHSAMEHAVEVASRAGVKKLVITHHDPDHNDNFLDAMERECQEVFSNCIFAREGLEICV